MRRLLATILLLASCSTLAQQPARILVGFPPGGSLDALARYLTEPLREALARPVLVENRAGAAGRLAVEATKAAAPDGNTLMLVPSGPMTIFAHIFNDLRFDPQNDFSPIAQLASQDLCLAAAPTVAVRTLAELRDWFKANPKNASFGSPGAGTGLHFTGVLFARRAGVELTHVPYKGTGALVSDLTAGHVPAAMASCTDLIELHRSGRLRILASAGAARWPLTPAVPTFREAGMDVEATGWFGLYGPAGMSPTMVGALNKAVVEAVTSPRGREQMLKFGLIATGTSADELIRLQKRESDLWAEAVKASGFKPEN
jgi:tripartite-type tricarboxylate transporter receptor subunit TctC